MKKLKEIEESLKYPFPIFDEYVSTTELFDFRQSSLKYLILL